MGQLEHIKEAVGRVMEKIKNDVEIKPCPFCGAIPVFPDAKNVYGTCYDAGCEDCCLPTISIQIIDCFDYPRNHVHDSWDNDSLQYGIEYIEVARTEAINAWNTRHNE